MLSIRPVADAMQQRGGMDAVQLQVRPDTQHTSAYVLILSIRPHTSVQLPDMYLHGFSNICSRMLTYADGC